MRNFLNDMDMELGAKIDRIDAELSIYDAVMSVDTLPKNVVMEAQLPP
jgi:hypothetical protein